jgi:hypothetical protein
MAGAIACYAGGSWWHPHASEHLFFENFWCDLLRESAHNGRPNRRSVVLATTGFVALAGGLYGFWLEIARLLPRGRQRFVAIAGPLSACATALVALVPSDRYPALHAPAVLTAGGLGFACGCVTAAWSLAHRHERRAFAALSMLLIAAATVNLVLYVNVTYLQGRDSLVLPAAQKVATLALLGWMVAGLSAVSVNRPKP